MRNYAIFNRSITLLILFIVSILFTTCNDKPQDDISEFVDDYNDLNSRIANVDSFEDNIDVDNDNVAENLEKLQDSILVITNEFDYVNHLVDLDIQRGEIVEGESITTLENLENSVFSRLSNLKSDFSNKYNGAFTYIFNYNQDLADTNEENIETLSGNLDGIEAQMQEILTELNAKSMTFNEMITLIQDLDTQVALIENLQNNINNDLNTINATVNTAEENFKNGSLELTSEQKADFEALKTKLNDLLVLNNEIDNYMIGTVNLLGEQIATKINEKFDEMFAVINTQNSNISTALNGVETDINTFNTEGGTQGDIDGMTSDLSGISDDIGVVEENVGDAAGSVELITSGMLGTGAQESLTTAETEHEANKIRHAEYLEDVGNLTISNTIALVDLLQSGLDDGSLTIAEGSNSLSINSQSGFNNFIQNLFNNENIDITYDANNLNLTIDGVTITGVQISQLAQFSNVNIDADLSNCIANGSTTLSDVDAVINYSAEDYSGQPVPQNPNGNDFSELVVDAENSIVNYTTSNQTFAKVGKIQITNYIWDGFYPCDLVEQSNYENTGAIPINYAFKFVGNGTIQNMQIGSVENQVGNIAKTLEESGIDYIANIDNIEFATTFSINDGTRFLDKAGNLMYGDGLNAVKIISARDGVDLGNIQFVSNNGGFYIINTNAIQEIQADAPGHPDTGLPVLTVANATVVSEDNSIQKNLTNPDNSQLHFGNAIILANITSNGVRIALANCMFNKISNGNISGYRIHLSLNPNDDVEAVWVPGTTNHYMPDANYTPSTYNVDVTEICDNIGGVLYLKPAVKEAFYITALGNIPVLVENNLMNCDNIPGLTQSPADLVVNGVGDSYTDWVVSANEGAKNQIASYKNVSSRYPSKDKDKYNSK